MAKTSPEQPKPNDANRPAQVINEEALGKISIYKNLDQTVIRITEDKARLYILEFQRAFCSRRNWLTLAGMMVAFGSSLVAADFKDTLFLKSAVWEAIFFICSLLSAGWLVKSLYHIYQNRNKGGIENLINRLKGLDDKSKQERKEESSLLTILKSKFGLSGRRIEN